MQYSDMLQNLSTHLQLPEIILDDLQCFSLRFDDMYLMFSPKFIASGECIVQITVTVGQQSADEDQAQHIAEELLCANLLGHGTASGYLGVNDLDEIIFSMQHPLQEMSFLRFFSLLEDFVSHAEYWINYLKTKTDKTLTMANISNIDAMRA